MNAKLQKTFLAVNILLLVCAMGCLVYYDIAGGLWLKGVTSGWFALLGVVNLIYGRMRLGKIRLFPLLMVLGLFFGVAADVLLGINFLVGVAAFALGHVVYLAAFCRLEKFSRKDLYFIIPLAALSLFIVTGTPFIRVEDPMMKKLLMGYAVIIAGMLGKAVSNCRGRKSLSGTLLMIGSILFWFSDIMLAASMFGTSSRLLWILCSYTYWPAQNILAHSLFHYTNEQ